MAVAPDGAIAAFCTVWFDDVTRSACLEPVATVPAHRRRGLGRAVATEGLRQARRLGADLALAFGYTPHANALYRAVMTVAGAPDDAPRRGRRSRHGGGLGSDLVMPACGGARVRPPHPTPRHRSRPA